MEKLFVVVMTDGTSVKVLKAFSNQEDANTYADGVNASIEMLEADGLIDCACLISVQEIEDVD